MRLPLAARTHRFVPSAPTGTPAPPRAAPVEESLEDRVGAQALRGAAAPQEQRDPWVEIAGILQRLLPAPTHETTGRVQTTVLARAAPAQAQPAPAVTPEEGGAPPAPREPREPAAPETSPGAAPAPASATQEFPALPAAHEGTALPPSHAEGGAPPATTSGAALAQPPVAAGAPEVEATGPDAHRRIVAQWRAGAAAAGSALPHPTVQVRTEAAGTLAVSAAVASQRQEQARQGLAADALATVANPPDMEVPPAAPPSDPVPEHTQDVLAQSRLRLYDMPAPPLVRSPGRKFPDVADTEAASFGGNAPALGEQPVAPDLFQVLTSPGARSLAAIPGDPQGASGQPQGRPATLEAQRLEKALALLTRTGEPEERNAAGQRVLTPDTGPRPVPPLPPHLRAQQEGVGQVVARLLAQGEQLPHEALATLRRKAFHGGVLAVQFPDIGAVLQPELATLIDGELREIAAAAGVSDAQLAAMEAGRRRELAASTAAAGTVAAALGKQAADTVVVQGQRTMDTIRGAADQAEEETLRRQETASGGADPEVIRARRDRTVGWIREHVTTVTTHYQQAGERRSAELGAVRDAQGNAYRALVQREQYQVLTPQPPLRTERDLADTQREAKLAKVVNEIRLWGDETVSRVDSAVGAWLTQTAQLTRTHRAAVEQAGSAGIEAARAWAEDRELEGQSWWSRLVTRLRRWLAESRQLQEQWQVRRTAENRDAVARDLNAVEAARARLAEGLTQDQVLADETLSAQQRAIIEQYFDSEPGLHPLEFAARQLRDGVALGHMERARAVFEQEITAMPVEYENFEVPDKINEVAKSLGGGFDAARIAQQLHGAMDQMGTNEAQIYSALGGMTPLQGVAVRKQYFASFGSSLEADLESELSGDEEKRAMAALQGQHARSQAIALHDAIAGAGTDEAAIMATLRNKTPAEVEAIEAEYLGMYGVTLRQALEADLAKGNEFDQADALLRGDTADADAIALDDAMRGGITGLGTSEAEIEEVQQRVRSEVLQLAQSQQWSSAQLEAEVRRRLDEIGKRFATRYAKVEQYNAPGLEGTVLQRAFQSELSGAERDLANAMQRNDPVAADAARIQIERTSFYASDEKLRGVLRSQYERALEARRLDEGPAQHMQVERLVKQLREQRPVVSEEQISRQRMALERKLEHEMEGRAQKDSKVGMEALTHAYESNYNRLSLAFDMEMNTSGPDQVAARAMLKQGGRLDPLQEVEYAVAGAGTDEEVLRRVLGSMTFAEIEQLRKDWRVRHPDQGLDERLWSELSGRDASDIMDMVENGAPESALEQIETENRRVDRELNDLTGVVGATAAGGEAKWLEHQRKQLLDLRDPLRRTDWPDSVQAREEREKLAGDVEFRVTRVREAVDDHRRRLDSYTDMATQIVGMTVGIVVAVVLGAVSGGTLGALTIALMASLMATVSTMATKALILGGAYGHEDILTDAAVGVVDAAATVATAGVGTRLLKPMKGLVGRTRIGDLAGRLGRTSVAQGVGKMPLVGSGAQRLGRAVGGRAGMERMAASFLAEGAEDAVSAMPSSLAQMAMNDQTWRGDPLMNFLEGGGMAMLQSAAMGRAMAGGKGALGHFYTAGRTKLRMGSEVGRLLEANRLLQEGFRAHAQDNPGASLGDFLSHPDGRKLRDDINKRGLLPTLEGLAAEVRSTPPRPEAEGAPVRTEAEARAQRAAELPVGVPKGMREHTDVTPDPDLPGNTVLVVPRRVNGRIVGVDVRAGPGATALDIALHAATIDAMQRYRGVLGNLRRVLEDTAAFLTGSGLHVGSRGWEARLELGKLSAVVASRMDALGGSCITPEQALHLRMEVEYLQLQIAQHAQVLKDPLLRGALGEGYVAAKGKEKPATTPEAKAQAQAQAEAKPKQPRKDVKFNERKQAELEIALAELDMARASGNRKAVMDTLQKIAGMTGGTPGLVSRLTRLDPSTRSDLQQRLEEIGQALREGRADEPHVRDAIDEVRDLTNLNEDAIRRLAQKPDSEPALAILLGVELSYHAPRSEAQAAPAPQPKPKPEGPPRPTARQLRKQAETRIAERTMRGPDQSSFGANTRDPGWAARMALAAFVSAGAGVRTFDEFLKSPAAEHLLGKGRPRTQAEHIALEQAFHQGLQAADQIRSAGKKLKIRNGIVESFFPLWAANHQRDVKDVLRAMEEWAVSGETGPHRFPARMLDPETRSLLGTQERQVSRTALPQRVQARATKTGGTSIEVGSALLPGTLSRRELPGQPAAPSFNNEVRKELKKKGVFKEKPEVKPGEPGTKPEANQDGKLEPKDWQVMHLIGPSSGIEGAMGMVLGPTNINTGLQTHAIRFKDKIIRLEGIEPFMNDLARVTRAEGGDVWVKSTVETFGPGELTPDMQKLGVTFFKSVTYEIHVSRPGRPDTIVRVSIEADMPPSTNAVVSRPEVIGEL